MLKGMNVLLRLIYKVSLNLLAETNNLKAFFRLNIVPRRYEIDKLTLMTNFRLRISILRSTAVTLSLKTNQFNEWLLIHHNHHLLTIPIHIKKRQFFLCVRSKKN